MKKKNEDDGADREEERMTFSPSLQTSNNWNNEKVNEEMKRHVHNRRK